MYYQLFLYALWFISVSSTFTSLPDGTSHRIYQWSENRFPQNFTIDRFVSNHSVLISPLIIDRNAALDFIQKYSKSVVGIIIVVLNSKSLYWSFRPAHYLKDSIPVGIIISDDKIVSQNGSISVTFNDWDSNIYSEYIPIKIPFYFIEYLVIIICFVWCCKKIYNLIIKGEFRLTIGPVCLILELLNTFARAIMTTLRLDTQLGSVYTDFDAEIFFCYTISAVFTISSGIFIVFFWLNLMALKIFKAAILNKAFWPSFGMIAGMFIIVIVLGTWNFVTRKDTEYITYFCSVLIPLLFILAILYFYTGYKVVSYSKTKTQTEDLKIIAYKMILSGVFFLIIVIFSLFSWKLGEGRSQLVILFILDLSYSVRSYLQIDVFGTIKKKDQVIVEDKTTSASASASTVELKNVSIANQ